MEKVQFHIPKYTDREVVERLLNVGKELPAHSLDYSSVFGTSGSVPAAKAIDEPAIKEFLDNDSSLIRYFYLRFAHAQNLNIQISREDLWHDKVEIHPGQEQDQSRMLKLVVAAKKHLGEIVPQQQLAELVGEDMAKHYAARDQVLSKQELMLSDFFRRMQQYSTELTEQYQKKTQALEDQYTKQREVLQAEYALRAKEVDDKRAELDKIRAEIDDRDSRHVRRKLRDDLKKELANRSTRFELTTGTRRLRTPIFWFTLMLMALFATGAVFFIAKDIAGGAIDPWHVGRQITFTIAFGCTAIFFIRWNHRWFQQHADEEFKLKRLQLDIDRASWLVEMAMEWKDEKGTEIPKELLDRLSVNLFSDVRTATNDLHPAEILASAIFGSAANVSVKTPDGTAVSFDRKSIRQLRKLKAGGENGD